MPRMNTSPPSEAPRVELALVPPTSPFAPQVKAAALACGAAFVRADMVSSADVAFRLLVVDLTRVATTTRHFGPQVIAITEADGVECYDVIRPDEVERRLARSIRNLVEVETVRARMNAEQQTIQVLNQIGYALSAITDRHQLLDEVLTHSRRALRADGGTVYLIEDGMLRFSAAQNDTVPYFSTRRELPIDDTSIAGFVAHTGAPLNIPDVRGIPGTTRYRPNLSFDETSGYRTVSMLLVPLMDRDGRVIGVLALVNHKPVAGIPLASFEKVSAFTDRHVALARSIASQAAVALENWRLYREIQALFDGFVEAAVTAIEARDPSTGGHSWRVAQLTTLLAQEVSDNDEPQFREIRFSPAELTELHYASLLHDFGKVGVREDVLLKAEKLYPWELSQVELRFRLAALQATLESLIENLEEAHLTTKLGQIERDLAVVRKFNRPSRMGEEEMHSVAAISQRWHLYELGEPVLRPREVRRLCIPYGTLDPEERLEIERHVEHTYRFLRVIPWTRELSNVPALAHAHHEKLDGTGYPRRLKGEGIPYGARLMTVSDIFDALTAGDRPYKGAMSPAQAVTILRAEAAAGKIMSPVVELLAGKKLWTRMRLQGE